MVFLPQNSNVVAQTRSSGESEHGKSDHSALVHLIGDEVLQANAPFVIAESQLLDADRRFALLSRWVLPGDGHGFRCQGKFIRQRSSPDRAGSSGNHAGSLAGLPESKWIASPALDLIRLAAEEDRLEELRQKIHSTETDDEEQAESKSVLLTLVEIASNEIDAVKRHLDKRFEPVRAVGPESIATRWGDLLILWLTMENPTTADLVTEDLFEVYPELHFYPKNRQLDVLNDYLALLKGFARQSEREGLGESSSEESRRLEGMFDVFAQVDSVSHSLARPLTRFEFLPSGLHKISGHEFDYLFYRSPLVGDCDIHAKVLSNKDAHTDVFVHGQSVNAIDNGSTISVSNFDRSHESIPISPPTQGVEEFIHSQVVVKNGNANYSINGRDVFSADVRRSPSPWAALKSWRRTLSDVLRIDIVNTAEIPASIDLVSGERLDGWIGYYDKAYDRQPGIWKSVQEDSAWTMVSDPPTGVPGSKEEDLIRYCRPISWNAKIEFEFFYTQGMHGVHPAIGRHVFLMSEQDVRLHELTNGPNERHRIRPDNVSRPMADINTKLSAPSLRHGWNHAAMTVVGDRVQVILNGGLVAQLELQSTDSRTFGFFRYRDASQSKVRNVRLTGAWPRKIPPLDLQPMSSELVNQLTRQSEKLADVWRHDFADGVPEDLFRVHGDEPSIVQFDDGVHIERSQGGGISALEWLGRVHGDFDLTLSYSDLVISDGKPTWHCGFGLEVNLDNPRQDQVSLYRRRDRIGSVQCVAVGTRQADRFGTHSWAGGSHIVDESKSGRLRLSRRGDTVYALHAIGESPIFRLIGEPKVAPCEIAHAVRLCTQNGNGLSSSVLWHDLEVRAERIDKLSVEDSADVVAMLNQQRKSKNHFEMDFRQQDFSETGIVASSTTEMTSGSEGTTFSIEGYETAPKRVSMNRSLPLKESFDLELDFDILELDCNVGYEWSSEILLRLFFESPNETIRANKADEYPPIHEATIIMRRTFDDKYTFRPRVVSRNQKGARKFRLFRTVNGEEPDQFRIVQHDKTLYFLCSYHDSDEQVLLAQCSLERPLIGSHFTIWMIAAQGERVAKIRWNRISAWDHDLEPEDRVPGIIFQGVPDTEDGFDVE